MHKLLNPPTAPAPFSRYSQGVEVEPGRRWLSIAGQVGVDATGRLADTIEGQHEQCWANVLAVLTAAGMGPHDLVKVTIFVTTPDQTAISRQVRDRMLQGATPTSTLLVVAGLATPDLKVEIEAWAAA
jgi:enamine deaminase RidA (YjgF/YER057c/UK114 family)